jgi:hypothetical protein
MRYIIRLFHLNRIIKEKRRLLVYNEAQQNQIYNLNNFIKAIFFYTISSTFVDIKTNIDAKLNKRER